MLRCRFLGGYDVDVDSSPVHCPGPRAPALLALLVLSGGHGSRDWLCGLLWPDSAQAQARTNLRNAVFHLRKALGPAAPVLQNGGDELLLVPGQYTSDVDRFLRAAARPVTCDQALAIYLGELLSGLSLPDNAPFEEWLTNERDRLSRLLVTTIVRAYDRARLAGDLEASLSLARRWVVADRYDERARRALMRALFRVGDRGGSLHAYTAWRDLLARELKSYPAAATEDLYDRIVRSVNNPPSPLPAVTPLFKPSFVGRDTTLTWLDAHGTVDQPSSLLLISGETGSGKSRLLSEYRAHVQANGDTAILGRMPPHAALPFQALSEAARSWLEAAPEAAPEALLAVDVTDLAELARLLPVIRRYRTDLPTSSAGSPDDRAVRSGSALCSLLVAAAGVTARRHGRLVLCLDDIDRAEAATRALLTSLLCHVGPSAPLLVVATICTGTVEPSIGSWLADLGRLVHVEEHRLAPLSPGDITQLLRSMAGPGLQPLLDRVEPLIVERSSGLPLFAVELLRACFDRGTIRLGSDGRWSGDLSPRLYSVALTTGLRALLHERVTRLRSESRELLTAAVLLPEPFRPTQLFDVCSLPRWAAALAFEELIAARFVVQVDHGYVVSQRLIRELLTGALPSEGPVRS